MRKILIIQLFIVSLALSGCALRTDLPEDARYLVAFNARASAMTGYSVGIGWMNDLNGPIWGARLIPRPSRYVHAAKPALMKLDEQFYLYYGGFDGKMWEIALYSSLDGVHWRDRGAILNGANQSRPVVLNEPKDTG